MMTKKLKEIAKQCKSRISSCADCPYARPCFNIKTDYAFWSNFEALKEMEAIYDEITKKNNSTMDK